MARRLKANEYFVVLTIPCGLTNADTDFRVAAPSDGTKVKRWSVTRTRAGAGTAVIAMGVFSGALGTNTRIMADVTNTIASPVGALNAPTDAIAEVTFNEGDPIFIFLNYDVGTVTAECVVTVTLFLQY